MDQERLIPELLTSNSTQNPTSFCSVSPPLCNPMKKRCCNSTDALSQILSKGTINTMSDQEKTSRKDIILPVYGEASQYVNAPDVSPRITQHLRVYHQSLDGEITEQETAFDYKVES